MGGIYTGSRHESLPLKVHTITYDFVSLRCWDHPSEDVIHDLCMVKVVQNLLTKHQQTSVCGPCVLTLPHWMPTD